LGQKTNSNTIIISVGRIKVIRPINPPIIKEYFKFGDSCHFAEKSRKHEKSKNNNP
jgi:hypothetical protein